MASDNEINGKIAEYLFAKFLNENNMPYYIIDQNTDTFSKIFKEKEIQRPDFLVFFPNDEIVYYDVKYRTKRKFNENEKRFYLKRKEIVRLYNFHKEFCTKNETEIKANLQIAFTDNVEKIDFYYYSAPFANQYYNNILELVLHDNNEYDIYEDNYFYFIPENMLSQKFSSEQTIFQSFIPDSNYFKQESDYHKKLWEEWKNKKK